MKTSLESSAREKATISDSPDPECEKSDVQSYLFYFILNILRNHKTAY